MEKGITVVGLGPGSAGHLSLETMAVLKSGGKVILRTAVHPTVKELERSGIKLRPATLFMNRKRLLKTSIKNCCFHFTGCERAGGSLCCSRQSFGCRTNCGAAEGTGCSGRSALKILPAMSFLDLAYVDLGIDPIAGCVLLMPMILMRCRCG